MWWFSPPTRREISLLLFSFAVFVFAYNLDIALSPHNLIFRKLGLSGASVIGKDGRRPRGWRDRLEDVIFGEWRWEEGHVAGEGPDRRRERGTDRYGAQWLGRLEIGDVSGEVYGPTTANDAVIHWGDDVPVTTLVKHIPGFTILDGAIILDGALYLITDDFDAFPPPTSIMTQKYGTVIDILSKDQAPSYLGDYAGKIAGVTFLSNDPVPHNSTLLSLWRTYSSLDTSIDASGHTTLPLPRRLFLPRIPAFSDLLPKNETISVVRPRSLTGFHPYLAKAAFPTLEIMYHKDWMDYHSMDVPFVVERLVIVDRGVASRMGHRPPFSPPFEEMPASEHWWEPIRRTLTAYLEIPEDDVSKRRKPVVTYLSCQDDRVGLRLRDAEHASLIKELAKMGRTYDYEVIIISERTPWHKRMSAIARSTVILGVHGDHLADSVFAKPSHHTTFVEFFPDDSFVHDYQIIMKSLGTRYLASWSNRIFNEESLPSIIEPRAPQEVTIDVLALVQVVRDVLQS